jgi:hypothetical protein
MAIHNHTILGMLQAMNHPPAGPQEHPAHQQAAPPNLQPPNLQPPNDEFQMVALQPQPLEEEQMAPQPPGQQENIQAEEQAAPQNPFNLLVLPGDDAVVPMDIEPANAMDIEQADDANEQEVPDIEDLPVPPHIGPQQGQINAIPPLQLGPAANNQAAPLHHAFQQAAPLHHAFQLDEEAQQQDPD